MKFVSRRILLSAAALLTMAAPALAADSGGVSTFYQLFIWPGGGPLALFIIILNVGNIAMMIERFSTIRRSKLIPEPLKNKISELFAARQYMQALELTSKDQCFLSYVVCETLRQGSQGFAAMENAMVEAVDERTTALDAPHRASKRAGQCWTHAWINGHGAGHHPGPARHSHRRGCAQAGGPRQLHRHRAGLHVLGTGRGDSGFGFLRDAAKSNRWLFRRSRPDRAEVG